MHLVHRGGIPEADLKMGLGLSDPCCPLRKEIVDASSAHMAISQELVQLNMAYLAYTESMAMDMTDNELTVTEARDNFSQLVNRAAFGGEVTFIHRGRNHEKVAAIVPADLVEQYEAFLDREDGRIAMERLADLEAGRTTKRPWSEVKRELGL